MKLKILGKYINKSGIESILVTTESKDNANGIAKKAMEVGATTDQVSKLITAKEYQGVMGYSFFMNCSHYTFEKISKFGVLDCDVVCGLSAKGFLYVKINVIDKVEQVNGYEAQEEDVTGWNIPAPENLPPLGDGTHAEPIPTFDPNTLDPNVDTGLPF